MSSEREAAATLVDDVTTHTTRADLQALHVLVGLLLGWAIPMRLKGLRACIDLIRHDRVGVVVRNEYVELQGTGLGRKATLGVSLQVLRVFFPFAWNGLVVATIASLPIVPPIRCAFKRALCVV